MYKYSVKIVNMNLLIVLVFILFPIINIYAANTPAPVGPTPNSRQVEWYHREQMGFIHFGMNTFYNVEWGSGSEDPGRFNPTSLNAAQWVKTFKDAGFTTIIMVAKHHDGFCLWPSAYTTHDVASSPWKSGKGDVIREVADACQAAEIKLGIYLSPWDRHERTYGTNAYNDYFDNQLKELLSNYGTIWEVWFDGAGEAAGTYDWTRWEKTIHTLQPNCIIWGTKTAYNYAEVRWVGNEGGVAGDPCWSTIDKYSIQIEDTRLLNNGQVNGTSFVPAETNTSIRPGWFYHSSENGSVKSVDTLWNYYFNSVGRNTVMLLNIPPDSQGLMYSTDANNVLGLYRRIYNTFANNLAADSTVTATDTRGTEFSPQYLVDKDESTYYASSDGVTTPAITFTLNGNKTFDCVMVQEVIKLGQRVTGWAVDAYYNNTWNTLVTKQCIGYKWIERFNKVTASAVRLRITSAKACPVIHTFGIYLQTNSTTLPTPTPVVTIRSAFSQIEAESYNSKYGAVKAETCSEGGQNLGYIGTGDYVVYNNIDFGSGAGSFQARVASTVTTGTIYVRLDTPTGTQIGTLTVPDTGNSQTYTTATCTVSRASGLHDLYLVFDAWANLNWFKFIASDNPTPTPTPTGTTGPTPTPNPNPIWSGGPYTLNGTSDYVDLPDGLTGNLYDFSVACWVKLNSLDTWSRIFDFGGDTNVFMMLTPASGDTGYPYFAITTSGTSEEQGINGTGVLATGSWQHLAVVKSGNTGILYINKQEVGRNTGMTLRPGDLGNTLNNYIGKSQWSNDPYLNGNIDKFVVYNRALSAAEVTALGNNPPGASLGDVNGSGMIDIVDALMTAQYSVGLTPDGFIAANADVNCDGSITIVDALMVAQYYVGLITKFC